MANTRQRKSHSRAEPSATTDPSQRKDRGLRPVKPPLSSMPMNRFIYLLLLSLALLGTYYSYRLFQHKAEVGGWRNLALGRKSPLPVQRSAPMTHSGEHFVEDKINELASALGMPSKELASAIAEAVRYYVPPASLSSIAAKETGPAVDALLKESPPSQTGGVSGGPATTPGVVDGVVGSFGKFVGMDEP